MTQMLNNRPGENENNSERCAGENRERSRNEGFEGMNYEQRRPSYPNTQPIPDRNDISRGSKGKRRDE